jgi:predicted RNA-binding Zn-ribbon protein involved in translation (DUF1610 family)
VCSCGARLPTDAAPGAAITCPACGATIHLEAAE